MIEAIISGKAYGKPAQRTSKTGAAFTVAKLRVAISGSESLFVNVTPSANPPRPHCWRWMTATRQRWPAR